MPSSVLQHLSPHSILFPGQPSYPLSTRVFECTCFVHNHTPGKDKLYPKSIKCVFLGYSRLYKGYKCHDPTTNKYFISADVTFFETSPYFSPTIYQMNIIEALPSPILPLSTTPAPKPLQVYSRWPSMPTLDVPLAGADHINTPRLISNASSFSNAGHVSTPRVHSTYCH